MKCRDFSLIYKVADKCDVMISQTGSSGWSLSWFLSHEAARSISTPPGRDASPSQVTTCNLLGSPNNSLVPIYTPGWREALWEQSVLPKNTTQCPQPGLELGLLDPGTTALTMRPPHLHLDKLTCKIIFFIAAQIAREVEKAEKTRAKEASSTSEASTSVCSQII